MRVRNLRHFGSFIACLLALAGSAAERPRRIVSLSLCTDQWVLLLADRDQIASLSYLSRDADLSVLASAAAEIPTNRGTAEEALALSPDLVLAGPWGARQAGKLLERLGYRVLFLPPADDFGTIEAQALQVAAAVGQPVRGTAMVEAMRRKVAAVRPAAGSARPTALPYLAGGYTEGSGTLLDEVLRASGFVNPASAAGISGFAPFSLEQVVLAHPDHLVVQRYRVSAPTLGKALLEHPALSRSGLGSQKLMADSPRLACGTPAVLDAGAALAAAAAR